MLTTGLDGASSTTSASSIAVERAGGRPVAFSAPRKAKLCVGTAAR